MKVLTEKKNVSHERVRWHDARVIFIISSSLLMYGATYSHLVSFFGEYNKDIGNSAFEYGLVLATYPLAQMLMGPFATKVSTWNIMTDKNLLIVSLFVDALFCSMPALLSHFQVGNRTFLYLMIALRIIQSVGGTTGSVLVYIISGVEIPHLTHIMIPILETVYGMAVVVGPAAGAVLCDFFGFGAPFLTLGFVEMLLAVLTIFVLPPSSAASASHGSAKFRKAVKPSVLLNILTTINTFAVLAYNEATLTYQLKRFDLSRSAKGLVFFFPAGVYAVSSLFFGFQIKRFSDARIIVIGGSLVSVLSLFGLGPLVTHWPKLWIVLVCQALFGFGLGPAFVCSYLHSVSEIDGGQESKEALAIVTGLMEPSVALGNLLGSLFAGWMLDAFSYNVGAASNMLQILIITVLQSALVIYSRCRARRKEAFNDVM
ncbi:synaptic vesicular amine transporter-like [Galendromus occidentalis]|uniref:Synaptic vesicular amine transporter-like n=1 Tax=Galendromus occidentalis TaxID=34638 RepID=A0AAJ7L663_9ACAR|nr:synaptic vesicular amine transporter-like [Galendromus occidentalis]